MVRFITGEQNCLRPLLARPYWFTIGLLAFYLQDQIQNLTVISQSDHGLRDFIFNKLNNINSYGVAILIGGIDRKFVGKRKPLP